MAEMSKVAAIICSWRWSPAAFQWSYKAEIHRVAGAIFGLAGMRGHGREDGERGEVAAVVGACGTWAL